LEGKGLNDNDTVYFTDPGKSIEKYSIYILTFPKKKLVLLSPGFLSNIIYARVILHSPLSLPHS
jgi:hypothetical protein